MMKFRNNVFFTLLMTGALFGHQSAEAACTVTVTELNFGEVNPVSLQSSFVDINSKLTYTCTGAISLLTRVYVCIEIHPTPDPRVLSHSSLPSNQISFNIFKDPTRDQIWGYQYGAVNSPMIIDHGSSFLGLWITVSGSETIYGRLFPSDQSMLKHIGSYAANMNVTVRMTLLGALGLLNCSDSLTSGNETLQTRVNLVSACKVSATDLNFGSQPSNFSGPINATSTINTHCSNGTPYQISLGNGLHADSSTRRMKSASGNYINYELYNEPSRTQRWGQTLNTPETIQKTSAGLSQPSTVYGQVQPTTGLVASTYVDTVTVTITY